MCLVIFNIFIFILFILPTVVLELNPWVSVPKPHSQPHNYLHLSDEDSEVQDLSKDMSPEPEPAWQAPESRPG